jgi:hypothetical protein
MLPSSDCRPVQIWLCSAPRLPLLPLLPIKLLTRSPIGQGHATWGPIVVLTAKVVGTAQEVRLFDLAQPPCCTCPGLHPATGSAPIDKPVAGPGARLRHWAGHPRIEMATSTAMGPLDEVLTPLGQALCLWRD